MTQANPTLILMALFSCLTLSSCEQKSTHEPPIGLPRKSATLLPGMGSLHHEIATQNSDAQKFFDQGLTFIYAFNFEEARRSFERASELDPSSAMPYWGMAMSVAPQYNDVDDIGFGRMKMAMEYIANADEHALKGPNNERDSIRALATRFRQDPASTGIKLAQDYSSAMHKLSQEYPDDPDCAVFYAESLMDLHRRRLWANDGKPSADTLEIISILEGVLRRWPGHVGANHFYIHVMEGSPTPDRALASAQRLETLVPAAGHLIHMPSHIFIRTGDYSSAVKSNEDAIEADKRYLREGVVNNPAYVLGYAEHNLLFLTFAAEMEGDFETSLKASKELESHARAALSQNPEAEMYLIPAMLALVRFGHSGEILSMPKPNSNLLGLTLFWHYARGCVLAAQGHAENASAERDLMEQTYRQIPSGSAFGILPNDWKTLWSLANHSIIARIAEARGQNRVAVEHWRAAACIEDSMIYHEPPDWYYPVRESLGSLLLRIGRPKEAENTFRQDLARHPLNPRSLFGLSNALTAQGRNAEAQFAFAHFKERWKGVPSELVIDKSW